MTNFAATSYEPYADASRIKTDLDDQRRASDVRPRELISSPKFHKIPRDKWSSILEFDYNIPPRDGGDRLLNTELLDLCAQIVAAESINGVFSIPKESVQKLEHYVERRTGVPRHPGASPEKPWRL